MLSISGCYIRGDIVCGGYRCIANFEGIMEKNDFFVLVVGGDTVGAWVLLVIAVVGWVGVGMEVVGVEHVWHCVAGLDT